VDRVSRAKSRSEIRHPRFSNSSAIATIRTLSRFGENLENVGPCLRFDLGLPFQASKILTAIHRLVVQSL
jgi:hypothetical protein